MPANFENSAVAIGLENVSFHSNCKGCSNYRTTALISHTSKVMLKILQSEWTSSKNPQITSVGKSVEKREPSYTVGRNVN